MWTERQLKRSLSVYEKSSLDGGGKALIMPATTDTEIEELVDVGYSYSDIVGVERDWNRFIELRKQYPESLIVNQTIETYIASTKSDFNYFHLDFNGHLRWNQCQKIERWQRINPDRLRIRITTLRGRQNQTQQVFEAKVARCVFEYMNLPTMHLGKNNTTYILCLIFSNFVLGMRISELKGNYLETKSSGRYSIVGVESWNYWESSPMQTIWVDLIRLTPKLQEARTQLYELSRQPTTSFSQEPVCL